MTATRLAATSSGGSGLGAGWFDVTTYGATGNGSTDDTAAIQAAMDACKAVGGTVYFPKGVYKVTAPLTLDNSNTWGVCLLGAGPAMNFDMGTSELRYTGTTGSLLDINSGQNIEIANLEFTYTSPSFTGDLIDIDGNIPHAADIQELHIHHCGTQSKAGSTTARSALRLERVIISSVDHSHFCGGNYGIYLGEPAGNSGTFIVGMVIEKCTFNRNNAHIFVGTGDGESVVIRDCVFEAGTNTTAIRGATVAVDGAGNLNGLYTPVIECNWFGDASAATKWIDGLNTINGNFPGSIRGNRFGDPVGGTHLTLTGRWNCVGNSFDGTGTVFSGASPDCFGNGYNGSGLAHGGTVPNTGFTELASSQTGQTGVAPTRLQYKVLLGPNVNEDISDNGEVGMMLYQHYNATQTPFAAAGALFHGGGLTALTAVASSGHSSALCAGTTPTNVVEAKFAAGALQLGFYNASPVAQAARAGQLTDSTGGTVTSTLAAGITDTVAKNAIASLAAKVNALETIIHNLGLSA